MKVGDWVRSDLFETEGEVATLGNCDYDFHPCNRGAITLVAETRRSGSVLSEFHASDFTVAEPKPE